MVVAKVEKIMLCSEEFAYQKVLLYFFLML